MGRRNDRDDALDIEFLAPDSAVFASASSSLDGYVDAGSDPEGPTDDDRRERGPRWLGVAAGGLVVALVAGAVIAAAPWSSDEDAAATPTTTAAIDVDPGGQAVTTGPVVPVDGNGGGDGRAIGGSPVETIPLGRRGYVIDDVRDGFVAASAYSGTQPVVFAETLKGDLQIWAAGSSRRSGSWIMLQTSPQPLYQQAYPDRRRVAVGDRVGFLSAGPGGTTQLRFPAGPIGSAVIDSAGLAEADVIAAAASVSIDDRGRGLFASPPAGFVNRLHTGAFDFDQVSASALTQSGAGATTAYTGRPGEAPIWISTTAVMADLDAVLPYLLDDFEAEVRNGSPVWSGTLPDSSPDAAGPPNHVVIFRDGNRLVTVESTLPVARIRALVASIRVSRPLEWNELVDETRARDRDSAGTVQNEYEDPFGADSLVRIGGDEGSPTPWSVSLSRATHELLVATGDQGGLTALSNDDEPIRAVTTDELTIVTAVIAPDGAGPTTLRLTVAGTAPSDLPMATHGDVVAVATAFTEIGPFTAEIIAADGSVLASFSG